ncbi:MAG: elongation factor 4 [Parcubacteria group bacterium CG11_big_fil_rev_8_21_14_0_20_39_22]|nr:MAG: elongation factor 4 [Parcubacteria group bacterium CG11_big_fil_rev_8_21_14_0_20_39_22]
MKSNKIRNFSIIAHIDHGKSTLADRMLEVTKTVEKRKMKEQVLDVMELERERGITIKMQPVRMLYEAKPSEISDNGQNLNTENPQQYILNLIDTPGHIDFSYEVSRALKAVEGAILLVDATQGVQAQTLSVLEMAKEAGLEIIPAVSKIDSPFARVDDVKLEISKILGCGLDRILEVSGKTGQGVVELLDEIVRIVPPPQDEELLEGDTSGFRGLIFDFEYSTHTGVIIYVRVVNGEVSKKEKLRFSIAKKDFSPIEIGTFSPAKSPKDSLESGEIGYIVTGIKEPGIASVGDTVVFERKPLPALSGYQNPWPVVWASIYPESQDDFVSLRQALMRLRLSDSSFTFEEESSGLLGRGFRVGFLGMLHLEIITERLRREFSLEIIVTTPSITYEVTTKNQKTITAYSPLQFPELGDILKIKEPWTSIQIISPSDYLGDIMQILFKHEAIVGTSETFGDNRTSICADIPLRELMRGFFDELKSASSGFASLSYVMGEMKEADVVRLDILVAEELVPAFSRVVSRRRVEEEAEEAVEKLFNLLPKQQFVTKIQAKAVGRIISSKTLSALKKDVTGHLYGGDITRKKKLWEKQKKGKKKMKERGKANIPHEVFLKMMRSGE